MAKRRSAAKPSSLRYYRNHADWIVHLAVQLAELSGFELSQKKHSDNPGDLNRAVDADIAEARELLKRIGIRTPDESAPAWHFAQRPEGRASEPAA